MRDKGSDPIDGMKAALDQVNAILRDTFIPAAAQIERIMLRHGGSAELARDAAYEVFARMLNMAKFGEPPDN